MAIDVILLLVGLIGLIVGSITDLQKREVADWISFGLIFAGIGLNAIKSIATGDYWFIILSFVGLGLAYLFSLIMFYTGQWGGGDAKVLMGLGALFGAYTPLFATEFHSSILPSWLSLIGPYNPLFLAVLLLNIAIAGSLYGLLWTVVLAIIKRKEFGKEYVSITHKQRKMRYTAFTSSIILLIAGAFMQNFTLKISFFFFGLLISLMVLAHSYVKTVEKVAMVRVVPVSDITEGEWIVDDVFDKQKKYICGPKDLGITNEQIQKLVKNKITKIKIKVGIPFIPAFLLGFIATVLFGNVIVTILVSLM